MNLKRFFLGFSLVLLVQSCAFNSAGNEGGRLVSQNDRQSDVGKAADGYSSNLDRFDKLVVDFVGDFEETNDKVYMVSMLLRCAALNKVMYDVLQRDAPRKNWDFVDEMSLKFLSAGHFVKVEKHKERGSSLSDDLIFEKTFDLYWDYATVYSRWMERNYVSQGEYVNSSSDLKSDVEFCSILGESI